MVPRRPPPEPEVSRPLFCPLAGDASPSLVLKICLHESAGWLPMSDVDVQLAVLMARF